MFENLGPITYKLVDAHTEKMYKFSLQTSLLKARLSPLFHGWTFLLRYTDSPSEELTVSNIISKYVVIKSNG